MNWTQEGITSLAGVLLSGGIGLVIRDVVTFVLKRKSDDAPMAQRTAEQSVVEQALVNVKASNEQLVTDITRVRAALAECERRGHERDEWWQKRYDEREKHWQAREDELLQEIDQMRDRTAQLLDELDALRRKALDGRLN